MAPESDQHNGTVAVHVSPADEHNLDLLANTHPADYENPSPNNPYNLVVLGAGTAGLVSAIGSAGLGARVALIEKHLMGGDCLNYGCVPSKGIIRAASAWADLRDASQYGVQANGDATMDFGFAMARMRRLRARISRNDSVKRYSEAGVDVFLGEGQFTGPRQIEVGGQTLRFARAVIATGGRAVAPPVEGLAEAGYLTNETVFSLTERPARVAVIGGGPIGSELAQTFCRMGSRVTLIHTGDHVLNREDDDAAHIVQESMLRDGVELALSASLFAVEVRGEDKVLRYKDGPGNTREVAVDTIIVSAGRTANVNGLGLEAAGVTFTPRGVQVDDNLRTTNPRIFAAGDVCSRFQFTHAADFMARIVIANALFKGRQKASALTIPWCTYTEPQIAHVGVTEATAKAAGTAIDTFTQPFDDVDRAILDGDDEGFAKVHVKRGSDQILGATIVARNAGDMIGIYAAAMTHGLGLGKISKVILPYPTQAEAVRKTGDLYNRTRLTPTVRKLMDKWLRWQRGR